PRGRNRSWPSSCTPRKPPRSSSPASHFPREYRWQMSRAEPTIVNAPCGTTCACPPPGMPPPGASPSVLPAEPVSPNDHCCRDPGILDVPTRKDDLMLTQPARKRVLRLSATGGLAL